METDKRISVRVGLFVMVGLALLAGVVFLLGGEKGFFASYTSYTASFETIDGLQPGSPVRLGGIEVGSVEGVEFYDDPEDKRVQVRFRVLSRYSERLRADSRAAVGSRGLLGDKTIDITLGSGDQPVIERGGELLTKPSADFTELAKKGAEVVDNAVAITAETRAMIETWNDPAMKEDLTGLLRAARSVAEEVQGGKGALHTLIYDESTGTHTRRLVANAASAAGQADAAVARAEKILAQVQSGQGLVGGLFYDPAGKETVRELTTLANELGSLARAVREEENGLLHQMVYGNDEGPNLGNELAAAAADLRTIVGRVEQGEGSLGALINDPTVYEDLKTVLGNVKRNRILRALVRYSISRSDEIEAVGQSQ